MTLLNIVTCGACGKIFGHTLNVQQNELTCPYCKMSDDPSSFPDRYYPPKHTDSLININK